MSDDPSRHDLTHHDPVQPDFGTLGLSADLVAALRDHGIERAFPVQAATIPTVCAGHDVAVQAPTGSGKTLAFGLPLLERIADARRPSEPHRPVALVLAPTRELAKQITDELAPLGDRSGVSVGALYGGLPFAPQIAALEGGIDVAVATPGRLLDLIDQRLASLDAVEMVVVDEADRLADLGFLPDLRRILDQIPDTRQTVLCSATLDGDVQVLVDAYLRSPVRCQVDGDPTEPNTTTETYLDPAVRHLIWIVPDARRPELLARLVKRAGRSIVFGRTRHGVTRIATRLRDAQVRTATLHGGNSQQVREQALDDLRTGAAQVLVCTDVAARGIHVDDVACVVQYDPPVDPKDYVHRAGRTGRAGASGVCVTLVDPANLAHVERLVEAAGVDAEFGPPDIGTVEHQEDRAAIDAALSDLAQVRRPGRLGSVPIPSVLGR